MSGQRVLLARAGAEFFAFPLGGVLEALDGADITPVPLVPHGVLGQCLHRGQLLPVLDPRAILGAPLVADGGARTVLVMVADDPFAIAMDDVTDMLVADASSRRAVPPGADRGGMVEALLAKGGHLAAIVDLGVLRATAASLLSPDTR